MSYNWLTTPTGQMVKIGEREEVVQRYCSGFNINAQAGYYLTAGHCLNSASDSVCYLADSGFHAPSMRVNFGYEFKDYRGEIYLSGGELIKVKRVVDHGFCSYKKTDYAVLQLEPGASRYGDIPISFAPTHVGEKMAMAHHPRGDTKHLNDGIVQAHVLNSQRNITAIDHTIETYGGSSGAPLVSQKLKAAKAVHVAGTEGPNRIPDHKHHYAVPIYDIATQAIKHHKNWPSTVGFFRMPGLSFTPSVSNRIKLGEEKGSSTKGCRC